MNLPLPIPDWLPRSNTVNLLAGAFLLSALYAAAQRRTLAAVTAYRFNSLALGGIALTVALATGARHIALAALLVIAVKGFVIPGLLRRQALGGGALETEPYLGVPAGMLVCGALVVIAFSQTRALFGSGVSILASCLPVSVATTLVGLYLMVSRKQALMQVVGLVILENAIFLAAVSLTYGMPLVVEMGVLLDLLVGVALLGLFVSRIEQTHGTSDTTRLRSLKG
ncbi:MAG: hydrogenase [Candidatus Eisenbacteria bacterium]